MLNGNATYNASSSQNTTFLVVSNEFLKDIQELNGFEINVAYGGKINITVNKKRFKFFNHFYFKKVCLK